MSGQKKHPLEIFRSSGQSLGRTMGGREASPADPAPAPPESAERTKPLPTNEFELRLSLPGSLILLFVWILAMGVAYMIGYGRGQDSERVEVDRSARALGDQIESGGDAANPAGDSTTGPRLYGVLLITYQDLGPDRLKEKLNELKRTLRDRYQIDGVKLSMWPKDINGKTMFSVYAGRFEKDDDSELLQLKGRLARINDYPDGSKRPFESARVAALPGDPDTARRAE